jgi:hypothetical protein
MNRLHKKHAATAEILHDVLVMDDFMEHVNRGAVSLQGSFNSLNSHLDSGTVAARLGYDNLEYSHGYILSLED